MDFSAVRVFLLPILENRKDLITKSPFLKLLGSGIILAL